MFAPEGYVSLAKLWRDFIDRRAAALCEEMRSEYPTRLVDDTMVLSIAGSPADFVEECFIRTFDQMTIALCGADGRCLRVLASDRSGYSRRMERLSAFEAATFALECGVERADRGWLKALGGDRFVPWPLDVDHAKAWKRAYISGEHAETPFEALPFHTVPYIFRRHQFTVPAELPPWTGDAIDEYFIGSVIPHAQGCSFCIESDTADLWSRENLSPLRSKGRPNKKEDVARAYFAIFPEGHNCSWKEVVRTVEGRIGMSVNEKTLQRGIKEAKAAEKTDKTRDKKT